MLENRFCGKISKDIGRSTVERADKYKIDIELLFREWKNKVPSNGIDHGKNVFIRDGVVCPEQWFSQKIRPLFLLKEAYHKTGDWDLIRDHLLTNDKIGNHITWKRVSQWTHGLLHTSSTYLCPFGDEAAMHYFGNEQLRRIAVVNVKKSDGAKGSGKDNILQYAKYDCTELRRELELIDPTIIVCGYTISSLNIIMGYDITCRQNPNLYYFIRLNGHNVIVLDYYHPSNRYPDVMNYYGLMGSYYQALTCQSNGPNFMISSFLYDIS